MKKLNWFNGAFQLHVQPGKFVHWVTLRVKGLGELTVEYSTEKMLMSGPASEKITLAYEDDDFGDPDETMRDAYEECIDSWEPQE